MTYFGAIRRLVVGFGRAAVIVTLLVGAFGIGAAATMALVAVRDLPAPQAIASSALVSDATMFDRYDRRLAAFRIGRTHREVVPFAAISPYLRAAVVASEDERFWSHRGLDFYGIARAAFANITDGRRAQGGSTITQQLLKLAVLEDRPAMLRKVEEAMLARRFEMVLTKEDLLALYLNAVYFGDGYSGVEAAVRGSFGLSAATVSISEAALLTGRIPAPNAWSPTCASAEARRQQQRVLRRMRDTDAITADEYKVSLRAPVRLRLADETSPEIIAGLTNVVERVAPFRSGDRMATTFDLAVQQVAVNSLRATLERYTRERGEHAGPRVSFGEAGVVWANDLVKLRDVVAGWRANDNERLVFDFRAITFGSTPPRACRLGSAVFRQAEPNGFASGVVTALEDRAATISLGDYVGRLDQRDATWTRRPIATAAPIGAVVDVRLPAHLPRQRGVTIPVTLIPRPLVQGAVVVVAPKTREVLALVGGIEEARGSFHRALQARRAIGSTVKPFTYALALTRGVVVPDAILHDVPISYVDPWSGATWEPANWYEGYDGDVDIARAIARSVNIAAVETAFTVGITDVAA
ncbi:MAG: transglycosylase domain-containing protein, partial [Candidatus Uhrbacteria bacterium]